ncbi:MAG: peptidylprolyl isomerase [Parvularculaceae bacterium]
MLHQVRNALKGVIAWFFVALLMLAFAFWGVPELRNFTQQSALRVGDKGFTAQAVLSEFNRQVDIRRNESNGEFTRADALAEGLPDYVVSVMASRSIIEQQAEQMGLVTPRALVRETLQSDERFQNAGTGKFDRFVLQNILQQNSLTLGQFESLIRRDLLRNQLVAAASAPAPAPETFANMLLLRQTERRRVDYLIVTDEMTGKPDEPAPDDIEAYYAENPSAFTAPEYRTFTAVILRESDFHDGLEAPEEELRKLYEAGRERLYETPERRTLYQITFDTEAEAQAAVAALRQGRPFENIASERGLSLETQTFTDIQQREVLDDAVAEAAFAEDVGVGDIIDPVKGLFGWTVVQVAGVSPPETKTFEDVRDDIADQYLAQDARRRLYDAVDEIETARDEGLTLAAAAERAGVAAKSYGPIDSFSFTPGGAILDGVPGEVLTEAFQLEEGEESESLDLASRDGFFFVALDQVTPPALKPLDAVRDAVREAWRREERRARISETVRTIREAVENGAALETAAAPYNRAPLEAALDRGTENETFSASLRDQIFSANPGQLVSGPAGFGDAQVIAQVKSIGFARNQIGAGEIELYQQFIGYQLDQELLDAYVATLRDEYGVRTDRIQLDQIFSEGA